MKSRYLGQTSFTHGRSPRIGVVLVNLGTPEAPEPAALRRYLGEFLADPRVVEIPKLVWMAILHGVILRIRPRRSAATYAKIWTDQGSPLMVLSEKLTEKISKTLSEQTDATISVKLAMRYGNPSIDNALKTLQNEGAEHLLVLPLYPQYSGATNGSVADAVFASLGKWRWVPELQLLGSYQDNPEYIQAVANSIRQYWAEKGQADKLLMSFHGMPKYTLLAGDPYFCHCHKTARLIAEALDLDDVQWEMVFQSRFGKAEWLQPYFAKRLEELPKEGIERINVVCPGFAVDCVETLEEIAMEGRDIYLDAGGKRLDYIPALNDQDSHVAFFSNRILKHLSPALENSDASNTPDKLECARKLAIQAGAEA